MRRITSMIAAATVGLLLAGCGTSTTPTSSGQESDKTYQIGAVTIVSHPALDAISKGFQDGLTESGVKFSYEFQNPQSDQATLSNIVNTYASEKKDLYFTIATQPTQALAQIVRDRPILFAGVTDPMAAGVVSSWEAPDGNVTGMSDLSPVKKQFELIKEAAPNTKTVGIVYSSSEANSETLVAKAKEVAGELGLEIRTATVVNSSEVGQAAESLDVDVYYVPTDNTVVSAIEAVVQTGEKHRKLVFASDTDSAGRGAALALSIDYYQQGKQAAAMAVKILKDGAKPESMPVETQEQLSLVVNPKAAQSQGQTIPASIIDRATKVL